MSMILVYDVSTGHREHLVRFVFSHVCEQGRVYTVYISSITKACMWRYKILARDTSPDFFPLWYLELHCVGEMIVIT